MHVAIKGRMTGAAALVKHSGLERCQAFVKPTQFGKAIETQIVNGFIVQLGRLCRVVHERGRRPQPAGISLEATREDGELSRQRHFLRNALAPTEGGPGCDMFFFQKKRMVGPSLSHQNMLTRRKTIEAIEGPKPKIPKTESVCKLCGFRSTDLGLFRVHISNQYVIHESVSHGYSAESESHVVVIV